MASLTRRAREDRRVHRAPTAEDALAPEVGGVQTRTFVQDEEFVREDEFTCRRCRLILPRTELAADRQHVCVDCLILDLERESGALC